MKTFEIEGKQVKVNPATIGQLAELEKHTNLQDELQAHPISMVVQVLLIIISATPQDDGVTEEWINGLPATAMSQLNEVCTYFLQVSSPDNK